MPAGSATSRRPEASPRPSRGCWASVTKVSGGGTDDTLYLARIRSSGCEPEKEENADEPVLTNYDEDRVRPRLSPVGIGRQQVCSRGNRLVPREPELDLD